MFVLAVRLSGRSVLLSPSVDHVAMFIFLNYKEQIQVPTIFRKYKVQSLFMIRRILNIVTLLADLHAASKSLLPYAVL